MSRPLRRSALWLVLAAGVLLLSACGGRITNTNWAGLSTDGDRVYLAFGPSVLAFDPETQSQNWIFSGDNAVQFYSAPSVEDDVVIFGDYGRAGGFFSPRVTTSVYALENVQSGVPGELWINSEAAMDKIVAPPLQVGETVYVGTADNHMLSMNVIDGTVQWDFAAGHAIWGQPAFRDGTLYVTSMDRSVYALNASTGEQLWKTDLDGALPSSPVLGDDLLYVSSFDGNVHALEIASGEVAWSAPAADWVWGAPAVSNGTIYYSDIQGNLFAADSQTGAELWTKATGARIQSAPVVVGDALYVASQVAEANDVSVGALTAYATADGNQLWTQRTLSPLFAAPIVVGGDTIVVGTQDTDALLIGFDLATGQELWRFNLPESAN